MQVARVIGAAGSGKTTLCKEKMVAAVDALGGDPLKLGFASFTRTARATAVARVAAEWECDEKLLTRDGWFRTLHSTALKCIGLSGSQLLTDRKDDLEWISQALGVRLSSRLDDDVGATKFLGDADTAASLNCWTLARSCLLPLSEVVRFAKRRDDDVPDFAKVAKTVEKFEVSKRLDDRVDFTDLLLLFAGYRADPFNGIHEVTPVGDLPEVSAWLFDEQQDASPLLDACCKRLVSAPSVKWCYVVGDPFQAIYGFAGSSSECFLGWPAHKEQTMPKSYRCPAPILELGERCLRRMHSGYFDRKVAPADHEGTVTEHEDIDALVSEVDPNEEWLLVARTNFQASRLFAAMHNANKPCKWTQRTDGVTARDEGLMALYALEQREATTGSGWQRALELLPARNKDKEPMLVRGTKSAWKGGGLAAEWDVVFESDLEQLGATPTLAAAIRSGEWISLVDRGGEWRRQAQKHGAALVSEPKVRVGTVHSVKGEEADNVAFLTTTSSKVAAGTEDAKQHDEECRIAYVAVTRTRRNLHVINEGRAKTPRMEVL